MRLITVLNNYYKFLEENLALFFRINSTKLKFIIRIQITRYSFENLKPALAPDY